MLHKIIYMKYHTDKIILGYFGTSPQGTSSQGMKNPEYS